MAQDKQQNTKVLERGNIYFCYTPKVERDRVNRLEDVQQFYFILAPHGKQNYRLIAIGNKRLPEVEDTNSNNWCFVESVSNDAQEIEQGLRKETYQTKTLGERVQPAARPVGEGIYAIVRHQDHTNLVYALELPEDLGDAQKALGIKLEASYIITIKNPEASSPKGTGLPAEEKADLPEHLQNSFDGATHSLQGKQSPSPQDDGTGDIKAAGNPQPRALTNSAVRRKTQDKGLARMYAPHVEQRRFVPVDPPEFLDYAGVELILIGASANIEAHLPHVKM